MLKTGWWRYYVSQSYLAGIGIRSSLQAGLTDGFKPDVLWDSVTRGLLQGVTNIGLNILTEEFNIPPLVANIGFSVIGSAVEGLFSRDGLFKHMFDTYEKNTLNMLGYNPRPDNLNSRYYDLDTSGNIIPGTFKQNLYNSDMGNYYWQESAYMARVMDFAEITRTQGLDVALNTYATALASKLQLKKPNRILMMVIASNVTNLPIPVGR